MHWLPSLSEFWVDYWKILSNYHCNSAGCNWVEIQNQSHHDVEKCVLHYEIQIIWYFLNFCISFYILRNVLLIFICFTCLGTISFRVFSYHTNSSFKRKLEVFYYNKKSFNSSFESFLFINSIHESKIKSKIRNPKFNELS